MGDSGASVRDFAVILQSVTGPSGKYQISVSELTFFLVIGNFNYLPNLKFQIQFQFRLFKKNKFQFQITFPFEPLKPPLSLSLSLSQ